MKNGAPRFRPFVFAIDGEISIFRTSKLVAQDLFEWLGLGRPEFGAIPVSDLLARCRRRLWPMERNNGRMRPLVASLARSLENHLGRDVHFGGG